MQSEVSTMGGDQSVDELRRELAEAREQQAATAEILAAISGSANDPSGVFREIAASAARLCDGYNVGIFQLDGDCLRLVAHHGPIPAVGPIGHGTLPLTRGIPPARAVLDRLTIHVPDLQAETTEYPEGSDFARRLGFRTSLAVPLMRAGAAIGVITIRRTDARPFNDRQIDLLEVFADQAIIAIENTRLFEAEQARTKELAEALAQQTATSEVLSVISNSPTDVQPVLDAIVQTATTLCASYDAVVLLRDGDDLRIAAHHGPMTIDFDRVPIGPDWVAGSTVLGKVPVHVHDLAAEGADFPLGRQFARRLNQRTVLGLPLMREGQAIGCLFLRRTKVLPFTEKQIALLQTFADQAVIAIENARLFEAEQCSKRELQESLEYQTAISEVLSVISRSPSDLNPVLEAIGKIACRLCAAYDVSILLRRGDKLHRVFMSGPIGGYPLGDDGIPLTRGLVAGRAVIDAKPVHIADLRAETSEYPEGAAKAEELGHRTILAVPLLQGGRAVGTIVLRRREMHPFTPNQVMLLQTFADQAVIAIENARLFEEVQARTGELSDALEQQTATSEVLSVISRSPNQLQPVLDSIVATAAELCQADFAMIHRLEHGRFRLVAANKVESDYITWLAQNPPTAGTGSVSGRAVAECATVHIPDVLADPEYSRTRAESLNRGHQRTTLGVPLLREGVPVGVIALHRTEVRPFTDKQIELVTTFADQAVIAIENTSLFEAEQASKRELQESLEYQTATSEVLNVISRSPTELQPVLDAIAVTAARLCESMDATVWRVAGGRIRVVAQFGSPASASHPLTTGTVTGRAIVDRKTIHVHDLAAMVETEYPDAKAIQQRIGHRTVLATPLLSQGEALGAISVRKNHVHPFSDRQIALLQTFADQAVIAIENARLFEEVQARTRELQESLEYQTATSDVLNVISRSPAQVQPVLDAIAETAGRLCQAENTAIWRFAEDAFQIAAHTTSDASFAKYLAENPLPTGHESLAGRVVLARSTIHLPDVLADPVLSTRPQFRRGKTRTALGVPLLRDGVPSGVIVLTRNRVLPFTKKQIELVATFADQAVIAIENARLFEAEQASKRELQESLEYQTATGDVLGVISRSPTNVQPVFDTIARAAAQLCTAQFCHVFRFDGHLIHFAASHGQAQSNIEHMRRIYPIPPSRVSAAARSVLTCRVEEISDIHADTEYQHGDTANYRSIVAVPMLKDSRPVGAICMARTETGTFPKRQIELLRTFADQAVIAIENTRLFEEVQERTTELTEALEQQTATSEVLSIISSSPGELEPVFESMLANAVRICQGKFGTLYLREGDGFRAVAMHNAPPAFREARQRGLVHPPADSSFGRAARTRQVAHVADITKEQSYLDGDSFRVDAVKLGGYRSVVSVPMLKEETVVGVISLYRQDAGTFAETQIDLVKNFAKQAVIAIENTRLLGELRESLQQQTATADVLKAISRSAFNLQAVLTELIRSAVTLCEADFGHIRQRVGELYPVAASFGLTPEQHALFAAFPTSNTRGSVPGRALLDGHIVHFPDVLRDPDFAFHDLAKAAGFRAAVGVPLISNGQIVGVMTLNRASPTAFSEKQLALIETFADQAVIAIENTRLFEAEQASKRELQESLEYQTATSEVLNVISRSPTQVKPVLNTILETAARLCEAEFAVYFRVTGEQCLLVAANNVNSEFVRYLIDYPTPVASGTATGSAVIEQRTIHIPDLLAWPDYRRPDYQAVGRMRTVLSVPMLRENAVVGVITLMRHEVRPFTERQINLVETFADQAVIAIENTRLFEEVQARTSELQQALEYQTATGEVLDVIGRSLADVQPVFEMIAQSAARVCNAQHCNVFRLDGDLVHFVASCGLSREAEQMMRSRSPIPLDRGFAAARAIVDNCVVEISDLTADAEYKQGDIAKVGNYRSAIAVPICKNGQPVGAIALTRSETGRFPPQQVELLKTFADQAVIAIENTRLFEEVQERTHELAKTVEDLEIASQHKSQFVANMSHELRTPLAAILGYAELMQEGFYDPLGQKSLDALARIRSNGQHLLGLINTVLDIAKIEAGQFSLNLAEYALSSVVETVRAATESLAETKKIALMTHVPKSLPIGFGDEQRLTQVLLNLVGNAIKFTDTGEVRITAKTENGHFAVSVIDTGPGIPADQLNRVFDQFHQVDNSNTKKKGGTGLGLAIAKQIVEMHGGRVWVESETGKGATFQLQLPVRAESRKSLQ